MNSKFTPQSKKLIIIKAVLPVTLIFIIIFISMFYVAIPYLEGKLMESKRTMLKELTQTAWEIVQDLDYQVADSLLSLEVAQKRASNLIGRMKYGVDRKDYFWINDLQPVMIMHPYRADLAGKYVGDYADPEGFKLFNEFVKVCKAEGEGYVKYLWQKKDDSRLVIPKLSFVKVYESWGWIIGTGVYLEDVNNEISGITFTLSLGFGLALIIIVIISAYNIHHTIKVENEKYEAGILLMNSHEKYRNLAEFLPEIIYESDTKGKLTFANKNGFEAYGYTDEDFNRGMNIIASVIPRERDRFLKIMNRVLNGEVFGSKEFTAQRKDKTTFPVMFYISPIIHNENITGLRGLIVDISERKAIERKLLAITQKTQELNRTLEERVKDRTAKLEEVNKELEAFSYSVAHDLRTPLGVIEGFAKVFSQDYNNVIDENGRMFIDTILRNIEDMFQLIEDILEFSKVNKGDLQKVNINMKQMFEDIAKVHLELAHGRQINLNIENLPPVKGDERMIRQVVSNLISNAVKYTGKNDFAEISVDSYLEEGHIVYFVKDNGAGFDQKFSEKIFQVFERVHDQADFKGTGVGLAIVAKIIKRHHGKIWAESEPGKGATFFFSLPN